MVPRKNGPEKNAQFEDWVKIGRHKVSLLHIEKVLFPRDGITKGDLIAYYQNVAPIILPHLYNRAISMVRYPDGIQDEGFFQKNVGDYYPGWIKRVAIPKENGYNHMVVCNNAATLVYLANQACITPHLWLSRVDKLHVPDRMIFDLDPADGMAFAVVRTTALRLKELLEALGLVPFIMTTGSRGLHVVVPLKRGPDFDEVRAIASSLAAQLVAQDSEHLSTEIRKNKRKGKLFVDCGRNAYAQTSVAPYAVRSQPGAPVATPLEWREVKQTKLTAQSFSINNVLDRLAKKGDPWADINRHAKLLPKSI